MIDLEIRLNSHPNITPRKLKLLNIDLYNQLSIYAKSISCLPSEALVVFQTHGSFSNASTCVQCGIQFNPYHRGGITCTKSCQSLYMHNTRLPSVTERRRVKLDITNTRKRESGELKEISERAFRTRRNNHTEEEIADQYRRVGVGKTATAKRQKLENRINTISRIANILIRKSPLLILRIFYANGGIKIYGTLINELVNLGFDVFGDFRKSRFRYAAKHGLEFLTKCVECGAPCHFKHRFCSNACSHINVDVIEARALKLKLWNSIPENKLKTSINGLEAAAKKTPEERSIDAKKIYIGKSQEWIDAKSRKAIDTRIARGQILPREISATSEYKLYKNEVGRITLANRFNIPNIELRGKHTFHIDHIYPVVHGFLNKIPAELIGDLSNLRMLPAKENRQKNSTITIIPALIQGWLNANDNKTTL